MHRRLRRRCENSVIERVFRHLAADHDNEYMMIDSTIVRAYQHSAGARKKKGGGGSGNSRSRGGLKPFRSIAARYDKLKSTFFADVQLVSAVIGAGNPQKPAAFGLLG